MRIAITQRVELATGHGERRDCLDQRWAALMEGLGIDLVPVPNGLAEPGQWLQRQAVSGLILSGGNDLSHLPGASNFSRERDTTEAALLTTARELHLPVLGVCRGMQMLNHFLGGSMTPVQGHAGCLHGVSCGVADELFGAYSQVNSFHNWGITPNDLAQNLSARAHAGDDTVEAFAHASLPWTGIMWHPERPCGNDGHDARLIRHLFSSKDSPCA